MDERFVDLRSKKNAKARNSSHMSMSAGNNISVVTPEFDSVGQFGRNCQ